MCDASMVILGANMAGRLMQANAQLQQGRAAKTVAGLNAERANEAAGQAIRRGELEELRATMQGEAVVSRQAVMESGTGADVNVGGPQATRRASEAVLEVTRRTIQVNAAYAAYGLRSRAQAYYQEGEYAEKAGENAALGTFLSGIGETFSDLRLPGKPPAEGQYNLAGTIGTM